MASLGVSARTTPLAGYHRSVARPLWKATALPASDITG